MINNDEYPVIRSGASFNEIVTIRKKPTGCSKCGLQFDIPSADTVTVSVLDYKKENVLIDETQSLISYAGADWARSRVAVQLTDTQTATLTQGGRAWLRIKIAGADVDIADIPVTIDA